MFNCDKCGKTTQSGEAANKMVVATRQKTYRNIVKQKLQIDEETGEERPVRSRRDDRKRPQYAESFGEEIVKEILVCGACIGLPVQAEVAKKQLEERQLWWSPGSMGGTQV